MLDGLIRRQVGLSVMLNQGMWAWIALVGTEKLQLRTEPVTETGSELSSAPRIEFLASHPEALGVFTDLLLGRLAAQEAI